MKRQKAFSLLQLLIEVMITLFTAGIVVPSLRRICHLGGLSRRDGSICYPFCRHYDQEHKLYANSHSAGRAPSALKLFWDAWSKKE